MLNAPVTALLEKRFPRRFSIRSAAVWASLVVTLAAAGGTAQVDPSSQYQQFDGWGVSLCWWANVVGRWSESKREAVADLLFDPERGLGLDIVRYNIGGGDDPSHSHMRVGAGIEGYLPGPGQPYNWDADPGQRWMLLAAVERGATITEAFANSPPYWMTRSGCSSGAKNGRTNNLKDDHCAAFADYLVSVLRHFKDTHSLEFTSIDPMNEPETGYWKYKNKQEGCHFDSQAQARIIRELAEQLQKRGLTTRIAAMDATSIDNTIREFRKYDEATKARIYRLNTHAYHGSKRAELRELANRHGKRLFMSEICLGSHVPDKGGVHHDHDSMIPPIDLARRITLDLRDMRPNGWVAWQAMAHEQYCTWWKWNFHVLHGDMKGDTEEFWITRKYYGFAQYTRFIHPGDQMIGIDADDAVAFINWQTGRVTIVAYNDTPRERRRRYSLSSFTNVNPQVAVHRTKDDEKLVRLPDLALQYGILAASEPPMSITTYVLAGAEYAGERRLNDADAGKGLNRFRYEGDWYFKGGEPKAFTRDNHWAGKAGAFYEVRFVGTQCRLLAGKAPNHGIAAVSVDGGPEQMVDFYAKVRQDQALVFVSEVMPRGEHVIRVRVTGRQNTESKGPYIPADRLDVVP